MEECCKVCRYVYNQPKVNSIYKCRRYPPSMIEQKYSNSNAEYPKISPDGWCGEFRFEDKLLDFVNKG